MPVGQSSSHLSESPSPNGKVTYKYKWVENVLPSCLATSPSSSYYSNIAPGATIQEGEAEKSLQFANKVCKTALRYYNQEHGTAYVLSEVGSRNTIICGALWFHGNFTANEFSEETTKLFFLEANLVYRCPEVTDILVRACCILDGINEVDESSGCHRLRKILHPTLGFKFKGYEKVHRRNEERILSLRPRPLKRKVENVLPSCLATSSPSRKVTYTWVQNVLPSCLATSPPNSYLCNIDPGQSIQKGETEKSLQFCNKVCQDALQYYNQKHGTAYELSEVGSRNTIICGALWFHGNFTANEFPEETTKLFFVEANLVYRRPEVTDIRVRACCILDGINEVDECGGCVRLRKIVHPARAFKFKGYDKVYKRNEEGIIISLRPRP